MTTARNIIRVTTFDVTGETPRKLSERIINHDRSDSRKWLDEHTTWCIRNGRGVQVIALADDRSGAV